MSTRQSMNTSTKYLMATSILAAQRSHNFGTSLAAQWAVSAMLSSAKIWECISILDRSEHPLYHGWVVAQMHHLEDRQSGFSVHWPPEQRITRTSPHGDRFRYET